MPDTLLDVIQSRISQLGPMDLGEYMALCLGHPQFGYYMTRDPFGAEGDFITAPEVSQMFGEMIGVWMADAWMKLGSPSRFALVECGPGRGTLMADALRATKNVPGFHQAMTLYLMEISPVLKNAQKQALNIYDPHWIDDLNALPASLPLILIGNEFLDALPIRQIRYDGSQWVENIVALGDNNLMMAAKPVDESLLKHIPLPIIARRSGEVFECSHILNQFLKNLSERIQKESGMALFIDYGYAKTAPGNTLQAVHKHAFKSIFDTPGTCDLTAHVDFENIMRLATSGGIYTTPAVTQASFLQNLGILARADALKANADDRQKADIDSALHRLLGDDQMGTLFKVIALCHDAGLNPAGFA